MWHSSLMLSLRRPVAGVVAALTLATGFAGVARADTGQPLTAPTSAPQDDRDDQVSRDDSRPALIPAVARALDQRRAAMARTSVQIAVRERTLQANEFVSKRAKVEQAAKYAEKVEKLGYDPKTTEPRDIAKQMMLKDYKWGEDEFSCLDKIFTQESNWQWNADNPTSSAYGIPQALPGNKMASAGADWKTNPATQIKWGLKYIKDRYGTPCAAWDFKSGTGWY